MTPKPQKLITRGEVAIWLGVHVDTVRDNEQSWGLKACRVVLSRKMVRYREQDARRTLERMGVL